VSRDVGPFPIDGQPLMLAGAKASLSLSMLPELLADAQQYLSTQRDTYRRQYECIHADDEREIFVVPSDHWEAIGDKLNVNRRASDAMRRAHVEQFKRSGTATDRRDEFETTLEIRTVVVIGIATTDEDE